MVEALPRSTFASRGYRVAEGPGNYKLNYRLQVHTWYGADNSRSVGTLSLLLREAASNRQVWLGFGKSEIHVGISREERKQRLAAALDRMLAKFPPSGRSE